MAKYRKHQHNDKYFTRIEPDPIEVRRKQRIRYLTKRIKIRLEENPHHLKVMKGDEKQEFQRLARLMFKHKLPRLCADCGMTFDGDLQMHPKVYRFPILKRHLVVLCRTCHVLEHQRLIPKFPYEEETQNDL